jgi:hypothetical protein
MGKLRIEKDRLEWKAEKKALKAILNAARRIEKDGFASWDQIEDEIILTKEVKSIPNIC